MTTDLEMQLKSKYDELASGKISYSEFTTWFEQQQWPSDGETDRMLSSVELTSAHLKADKELPEDLSKGQLTRIGDYLHGRTDEKPASLGDSGMSRDDLRHVYEEKKDVYDR